MTLPQQFDLRRYAVFLLFLVVLVPATWALRQWSLRTTRADVAARKLELMGQAFSDIQADFNALQIELLQVAQELAASPELIQGLARRSLSDRPDDAIIRLMASRELPERFASEIYTPTPQLVAWSGYSMPLDDGPGRTRFLEGALAAIARDEDQRVALVVWWPVTDGIEVRGAVRAMRLLELRVPVENRFLSAYSQDGIWSRKTRLPVRVLYDAPFDDDLPHGREVRLLTGLDGTPLGRVFIDAPSAEAIVGRVRSQFDHVLAFWLALVAFWLAAGAWILYRWSSGRSGMAGLSLRFVLFAVTWWAFRFVLLAVDVPGRYQPEKAPLGALFDPTHLASNAGFGLLRSSGDLLITSVFALLFSAAFVDLAARMRWVRIQRGAGRGVVASLRSSRTWLHGAALALAAFGLAGLLGAVSRVVVLDSTLDYFARTGLLPEVLVLVVFSSLLMLTIAGVLLAVGAVWLATRTLARGGRTVAWTDVGAGTSVGLALLAIGYLVVGPAADVVAWYVAMAFGLAIMGATTLTMTRLREGPALLTLRNVLPAIVLLAILLYPLFYHGTEIRQQLQMVDAADSFEEGRDPRVLYGVERVLLEAARSDVLERHLSTTDTREGAYLALDSLANALLRNSFLGSLGSYEISMTIHGQDESPRGRYYEADPRLGGAYLDTVEVVDLRLLQKMYRDRGTEGSMVLPLTPTEPSEPFRYSGLAPVPSAAGSGTVGWVVVRAEPRALLREAGTPFPLVLVPSGFEGGLRGGLSVAAFQDGALVRSIGEDIGRYRLPDGVSEQLAVEKELWVSEDIHDRKYIAYYRLQENPEATPLFPTASVIAVRVASISLFDHLYNLLRLTFGGLILGVPVYVGGLFLRRRRGLLPASRVRFRDKVLNAFFGVGVVTVAAMGVVGLSVVTGDNEREVENWLRQHLERAERTIALDTRGGEMTYQVLERARIDSLAARVGLDINLYRDRVLVASSRPQLLRDRLIDPRLPIAAYEALYVDGFKFVDTQERLGDFSYTAGFRAIPDEEGRPHFILSVPTLPEQQRIEEERARTVAYLFGALLLLVVVVMITASLLANALARPVARLREGILAVTRGRFNRIRPLDTRDEIGELVDSFNTMQDQLAESRRRLAQQERQLAWREMARQIAHEIKNPLTPMKLSLQHLRRSFSGHRAETGDTFSSLFDRITTTLSEQIEALARIANEFSSFARMPQRIEEELDLNAVAAEAASLMEAEVDFPIELDLLESPLPVRADREELRRIYINLIKNAMQSIPDGRDGLIVITTRREDGDVGDGACAYTSVTDNGMGIPESVRSKIFEPNFSTKTSGTGLGLAIARKSVEDLHGHIGFETSAGAGTSFWVRLPLDEDGFVKEELMPRGEDL